MDTEAQVAPVEEKQPVSSQLLMRTKEKDRHPGPQVSPEAKDPSIGPARSIAWDRHCSAHSCVTSLTQEDQGSCSEHSLLPGGTQSPPSANPPQMVLPTCPLSLTLALGSSQLLSKCLSTFLVPQSLCNCSALCPAAVSFLPQLPKPSRPKLNATSFGSFCGPSLPLPGSVEPEFSSPEPPRRCP